MNKKSKKTLKNAFNIPEPERKEKFFSSLETKQKKRVSFNIPLYISTAVTAVVIMGIWGGVKNLPYFEQPDNIDTPVYSETTSFPHHTEKSTIQTTTVYSTKVSTIAETSGVSTVSGTEKTKTTAQTTIKTETITTTTAKESNNISHKPTTEIRTTERTSAPETELPETTKKTTATIRTTVTARTTTKNTTIPETTVATTTVKPTTITTVKTTTTTTKISHEITTTSEGEGVNFVTTTIYINNGVPQTTTSFDFNIQPVTTTKDDNGACAEPPREFTVVPPVQYYPDGEIYIIDSESNDGKLPTSPGYVNDNEIFREMAENSDLIAIVAVDEIIYTGFDGKPYTQENVIVKDVIYGDIPPNSRISIYCTGGYIPASEYYSDIYMHETDNVTVLDYAGNKYFSDVGDSYVCFLKKSDGDFPDGSYYLTGLNNISKFALYGDNCVNLNNNVSLTVDKIQSFFNQ